MSEKQRKLPKRNFNEDLETTSRKELLNVLTVENFEIRDIPRRDKGVDTYVELKNRQHHLGIDFVVQLKATRKSKKGKFHSHKIETSNIEYLLSHPQSSMYILFVEETNIFYYEWTEDFARRLADKNPDWEQQDSHTLRFQKHLTIEEAKRIYDHVLKEGEEHRNERDFVIQGNLKSITNSLHDDSSGNTLEDFRRLFDVCSGLTILPIHIVERIPPFSNTHNSLSYYSEADSTLYTDNLKLFQFFEKLSKQKNKIILDDEGESESLKGKEKSKLLHQILIFFFRHAIHHLRVVPEKGERKRICVHDLYIFGSCNCERCKFYRLDFSGALNILSTAKPKKPYELLRNAHTFLEIGDYEKSFSIYKKLIRDSKKEKNYVSYFMCKYALSRAYGLFRWNYFGKDRAEILDYIKKINLDQEINLLQKKHLVKDEIILALKWINNNNFIHYTHREIDERGLEIDGIYRNDKLGGWTSADHTKKLNKVFTDTTDFVEFNLLMYDVTGGYSLFLDKAFESMLMLHNLHSEHNTRLEGFNSRTLQIFLLQGSASRMNYLLGKHKTDLLRFDPNEKKAKNAIISKMQSFLTSLETIENSIDINSESGNHFFSRKCNDILKNVCVLISALDLDSSELNPLIRQLIESFRSCKLVEPSTTSYLAQIVNRRFQNIETSLLEEIYALSLTNKVFANDQIRNGMPRIFRKHFPDYKLRESTIQAILSSMRGGKSKDILHLIHFWKGANGTIQKEITAFVVARLQERFDFEDYYSAVMYDVIDYTAFWDKCIQSIPTTQRERESEKIFSRGKLTRNRRLNLFVDIALKHKIDLKAEEYKKLIPVDPYFKWLFNPSGFDYRDFNPMWLLEFHSNLYFDEFKKINEIKVAIKKMILEKHIVGLTDIYIKYFTE